jgi:hypothetical protein
MPVPRRRPLRRRWSYIDTAGTTIIADPVDRHIPIHGPVVIGIVHESPIDIRHRCIITETPTYPTTADITVTIITTPIIDTAIEPDMWPPITRMPAIQTTGIPPVTGRPKIPDLGRFGPITRHPIISVIFIIRPITGYPDITIHGTWWLRIDRNDRRSDT